MTGTKSHCSDHVSSSESPRRPANFGLDYTPPKITGKESLEQITLLSGGNDKPGGPGWIGTT
jgi:hypothetical protein